MYGRPRFCWPTSPARSPSRATWRGPKRLADEGEALVRSLGDAPSFELDFVEFAQGWLALVEGDHDRAQCRLEAALAMGRTIAAKGDALGRALRLGRGGPGPR